MLLHRVFQFLPPSDILAKISGTILDTDQEIKSKNTCIPNRKESSLLEQKGSVYDQLNCSLPPGRDSAYERGGDARRLA